MNRYNYYIENRQNGKKGRGREERKSTEKGEVKVSGRQMSGWVTTEMLLLSSHLDCLQTQSTCPLCQPGWVGYYWHQAVDTPTLARCRWWPVDWEQCSGSATEENIGMSEAQSACVHVYCHCMYVNSSTRRRASSTHIIYIHWPTD